MHKIKGFAGQNKNNSMFNRGCGGEGGDLRRLNTAVIIKSLILEAAVKRSQLRRVGNPPSLLAQLKRVLFLDWANCLNQLVIILFIQNTENMHIIQIPGWWEVRIRKLAR